MKFNSPYATMFEEKKKTRYRFEISIDMADEEIIKELEKHPNKSEYIRQLVREDIKKRG